MQLAIRFQKSKISKKLFIALWLLLGITCFAILFLSDANVSNFKLILFAVFIVVFVLSYRQLNAHFNKAQGIYWDTQQWYLLIDEQKVPIELTGNTRVFRHWILLEYQERDNPRILKSQLFLPKDRMSDSNFRNLARTLRF